MKSKYGYDVKQLVAMTSNDLSKLTGAQAADARRVLYDALNKRMKRIEKAGLTDVSGAYLGAQSATGEDVPRFAAPRGSNRNDDIRRLVRGITILKQQTSTVAGINKYIENVTIGLVLGSEERAGVKLTASERAKMVAHYRGLFNARIHDKHFWDSVREFDFDVALRNYMFESQDSLKAVNTVYDANEGMDPWEIADAAFKSIAHEIDPGNYDEKGEWIEWDDIDPGDLPF